MRAILIHFPETDAPIFQFIGDSESQVAFLRDWVSRNLNVKVEGQIPAMDSAGTAFPGGGECGRVHPALSETTPTFGFYSER
jgi:hypothetical protein